MPLTSFDYLTKYATPTWKYTKKVRDAYQGICPFHPENTPSFYVWEDGHWHCFGCDKGAKSGKIATVTLIKYSEFDKDDTSYGWRQAWDRYRELAGEEPREKDEKKEENVERQLNLLASEEQQAVLRVLEEWCHSRLWDPDPRFASVRGQRYYKEIRGIPLSEYRHTKQVAYAPPHSAKSREGALLFSQLDKMMKKDVGKDWKDIAVGLGILNKYYEFRLRDRIMFFCHDIDDNPVFYQGRKVELPGEPKNDYPKSMNPYGIKKMPFWVPVRNQRVKGTADIEGPTGALILPLYGLFTVAWLGGDPSYFLMRQFPGPRILLQDHDPLKQWPDGTWHRAGDEHAKDFIKMCDEELHQPWVRIIPGIEGDGPDDWVNRDGPDPLFAQLEAHDLLIPTNKTPTGLYLAQVS